MAPDCPEVEEFDPSGLPGYDDAPDTDEAEGADLGLPPNDSAVS